MTDSKQKQIEFSKQKQIDLLERRLANCADMSCNVPMLSAKQMRALDGVEISPYEKELRRVMESIRYAAHMGVQHTQIFELNDWVMVAQVLNARGYSVCMDLESNNPNLKVSWEE